jgi:hypothetical protein
MGNLRRKGQPIVGTGALALRLPALYTAAFAGEHFNAVMFASHFFWGTADVMLGRLQEVFKGRRVKTYVVDRQWHHFGEASPQSN